jgi:hypothetical protein
VESPEVVLSEDGFAVDFASSAFEAPDFVRERWAVSASVLALASASASEARLAAASRSSESFLAARSLAALFRDRRSSAAAEEASSERRCEAACACARSLPASAGVLLSTSAAKSSFPGDGSDLADFCGGAP